MVVGEQCANLGDRRRLMLNVALHGLEEATEVRYQAPATC
jgi:hypothetical protein